MKGGSTSLLQKPIWRMMLQNFEQNYFRFLKSNSNISNLNTRCHSMLSDRMVIPKQLQKCLISAQKFLSQKDYGKALSYFAYIVHTCPLLSDQVHDDFLFALRNWTSILAENGKFDDLVKCLEQAGKLFPNSAEIANAIGSTLFRLNLFDEAAVYFHQALDLDPQLSNAEENIDSIANVLVERWHFRMLNDKVRNKAYRNAIDRAVKKGCSQVLDIGSGTCILSMFAVQSGANDVFACEMSKKMYDLSLDILSANQMKESVHVSNKKSHDLLIPTDMPERVSLIVTETLDCGLLGEGIIETLTHAKRELLAANQKAQIIPQGATVYGQIIQCEKIRNYSKVKQTIFGHDVSAFQICGAEITENREEPYTTEDMNSIEHVCLSKPFCITSYDFQKPANYIKESDHNLNVVTVRPGCLDAVMVWFELRLDMHETLSSAPGQSVCWEQAVYPCQLSRDQQTVEAGDEVVLHAKLTSNAIFLDITSTSNHSNNTILPCPKSISLPYQDISKLNDIKLSASCNEALLQACEQLKLFPGQTLSTDASLGCIVLCSSPTFNPLFALWANFSDIICVTNDTDFTQCLQTLAGESSECLHFTSKPLEALSGSEYWQVLIVDPIEPSGRLRQEVVQDIVLAKGCVLPKDAGIVLPGKIEVWGMLISSSSLCEKSHVTSDDVTLGLDIAGYYYCLTVHPEIEFKTICC